MLFVGQAEACPTGSIFYPPEQLLPSSLSHVHSHLRSNENEEENGNEKEGA